MDHSRASSTNDAAHRSVGNVTLWAIVVLVALYATGYLVLRVASRNERTNVILPLSMMRQPEKFVLLMYDPVYRAEGRWRGIHFWRTVAPPPTDGLSWSEYQIISPK